MKRYILITRLTIEATGWRRYLIKVTLRGGDTYLMPTRSKRLYDCLNKELSDNADSDLLLQTAVKVLEFNDVFFDEVEFL